MPRRRAADEDGRSSCQESEPRPDIRAAGAVLIAAALLSLPAACSRRALADDAGGTGQIGGDGGFDVGTDVGVDGATAEVERDANGAEKITDTGSGAYACGAASCGGSDLCVETAGCGGPLNCKDANDAGVCPPGTTYNPNCLSVTSNAGCTPDCPPPSYACVPRPAACTGTLDCSCLDASFCKIGTCQSARDRSVLCAAV